MQNSITNVREKNKNRSPERSLKNVNKNCIINNSTFERKSDEQQFLFWCSNFTEILSPFLVEFFFLHIFFSFISRYFFLHRRFSRGCYGFFSEIITETVFAFFAKLLRSLKCFHEKDAAFHNERSRKQQELFARTFVKKCQQTFYHK